jgi:hypothetical protein
MQQGYSKFVDIIGNLDHNEGMFIVCSYLNSG